MREQGQKQSRKSDEGYPYLDTTKNRSIQSNFADNPYLDTSEDPSIQPHDTGGSFYLDTSED